jgi:hypothetical protein
MHNGRAQNLMWPPYKSNLYHRPCFLSVRDYVATNPSCRIDTQHDSFVEKKFFLNRKDDGDTKVGLVLHGSVVEIKLYLGSVNIYHLHTHAHCETHVQQASQRGRGRRDQNTQEAVSKSWNPAEGMETHAQWTINTKGHFLPLAGSFVGIARINCCLLLVQGIMMTGEACKGNKHVQQEGALRDGKACTGAPLGNAFLTCWCEAQWNGASNYQENLPPPARWTSKQRTNGGSDENIYGMPHSPQQAC